MTTDADRHLADQNRLTALYDRLVDQGGKQWAAGIMIDLRQAVDAAKVDLQVERDSLHEVLTVIYETFGVPTEMVGRVRDALKLPPQPESET